MAYLWQTSNQTNDIHSWINKLQIEKIKIQKRF